MKSEEKILDELKSALKEAGVSPIPVNEYLSERISGRLKLFQTSRANRGKSEFKSDDFSSPTCFAQSFELQSDYRIETASLSQIDKYIDQLISKEI